MVMIPDHWKLFRGFGEAVDAARASVRSVAAQRFLDEV
jgi:hypothetical protein